MTIEGILLVDKPVGRTSFSLVADVRRLTGVKKVGHAGTLDPFATGLLILLVGKNFTRLSDRFLTTEKTYQTTVHLGVSTDSYDCEGAVTATSDKVPTLEEVQMALEHFQGEIEQTPPMFSAKKVNGKKLYELARKGVEIERKPVKVTVDTRLIAYDYPNLTLEITCSKGTYIRSIGHDLGRLLGCGAHLSALRRTRSGQFSIEQSLDGNKLRSPDYTLQDLQASLLV